MDVVSLAHVNGHALLVSDSFTFSFSWAEEQFGYLVKQLGILISFLSKLTICKVPYFPSQGELYEMFIFTSVTFLVAFALLNKEEKYCESQCQHSTVDM